MIHKLSPIFILLILIITCGCTPTEDNYTAKEISLEETLTFAGIDNNVEYTDNTVNINYNIPVKFEEDLILTTYYILGATYNFFPDAKYRLIYEIEDLAYFTKVDSTTFKKYLEKEITLSELNKEINVYVR